MSMSPICRAGCHVQCATAKARCDCVCHRKRGKRRFGPDDPRHGTVNGYVNLRCRCDACRAAVRTYEPSRAAAVRYRRRLGMQPAKRGRTHGIRATYVHGCRCVECRRAEAEYRREYRRGLRRRQAS